MNRHLWLLALLVTASVAVSLGVRAAGAQAYTCGTAAAPRLVPGGQGRVTPGLPNVLRSQPGRGGASQIIGSMPGGSVFGVLAGYAAQCADGMWWTLVSYANVVGWTPEGDAWGTYWTEPIGAAPPSQCLGPSPRLTVGGQGRVTPGLPNVIRSQPYKGGNSYITGQIPAGGVFTVIEGPHCANDIHWWRVSYNGIVGWTGEGERSTYWTEPV